MDDVGTDAGELGVRVIVLIVPVTLTVRILAFWLWSPMAWGLSMMIWLLPIYWFPSRVKFGFWRWLMIVIALSLATFVLAAVVPE